MSQINNRVWLLLIVILGFFCVLGGRLLTKSLSTQTEYERKALDQMNYTSTVKVAMPGDILDSTMSPIATSYRVYILILDPKVILATEKTNKGSAEQTAELTAQCFDLDKDEILQAINENPSSSYLRFNKKTVVSEEQRDTFLKEQERINSAKKEETSAAVQDVSAASEEEKKDPRVRGVWFEEEPRRYYPYGDMASKLIGFTTIDTSQGLWGLEQSYDSWLRGRNGREYGYINSDSDLERQVIEPQDGYSVVTTLDMNLQKMASDALDDWYSKTDEDGNPVNSAKSVRILMMDPNSGAIKAYVSSNDFDLNSSTDLSAIYSDEEIAVFQQNQDDYDAAKARAQEDGTVDSFIWDHDEYPTTSDAFNTMWRNDLISDSFEPGSTGKVMTFAAALEEKVIEPDTMFFDPGFMQVANYIMKCHNIETGGCGEINAIQALASSCNVAFINIGQSMGAERFAKYQRLFNIGQKTGIDLPGEASCEGLLFSEDQLDEVNLATNAFGQCYNVTMLQLAAAVSASINGGYYYRPYLGSQILDSDGNVVKTFEPVMERQVISEETSRIVREAMRQVVVAENGTGSMIQYNDGKLMDGYTFIAKTGTAEKLPRSDQKYIISVVSAVPQDGPQMLVYVVIDEYGGELQADSQPAQELTGAVWGRVLDYLGIYSDADPGSEIYRNPDENPQANEAWPNDSNIIDNADGTNDDLPTPPEDDGSGSYDGIIVSPNQVISPDDVLPQPGEGSAQ